MSIFTGIVLYLMIYWVALFAVLPWGNRAPEGDELTVGHAGSAPVNPNLKKKFIATAVVAAILWGIEHGFRPDHMRVRNPHIPGSSR